MTRRAWACGLLALIIAAGAGLILWHWQTRNTATYYTGIVQPVAETQACVWPCGPINVNTADAQVLATLYGMNQSQTEALLKDRMKNGAYDFPEDLIYVKGIGEKTLAKLYDQLDFTWRIPEN